MEDANGDRRQVLKTVCSLSVFQRLNVRQMKRRNQSTLKQWFSNLMDFKKVKLKKWLELE